ncbi:MAG TPA: polymer-forming cytoskeletal protein [Gemmatimonadaceae bacterium]
MKYWTTAVLLAVGAGPLAAQTAPAKSDGDFLLRINAPVTIAPADSAATVWVIAGDIDVKGTVRDQVIVMGGTARISGTVEGGVAVFNGSLELAPTARVDRDVFLYRSTMTRESGAVVGGKIDNSRGPAFGQMFALGFWLSTSLVVVAFGLLLAAVLGNGLNHGADVLTQRPGAAVVTSIVVGAGVPLLIAVSFATVIGIPLGIATLVFLIPTLGFLGLAVSGTALGRVLMGARDRLAPPDHPYRDVAVGLIVIQVVAFVPVLGGLVVLIAAAVGAGALVYRTWTGMRGSRAGTMAPIPAH